MFDNLKQVKNIEDAIILNEYNGLRKLMNGGNIISPKRFIYYVQEVATKKGRLCLLDSNKMTPEFLIFLLDRAYNSICRPISVNVTAILNKNDNLAIVCYKLLRKYMKRNIVKSWIYFMEYMFPILHLCQVKYIVLNQEYYSILDLPMNDNTGSLYDCFDIFTNADVIDDYVNDKTRKREKVTSKFILNFPKILMICLKRYNNHIRKRNKMVECPEVLDLTKYKRVRYKEHI